MAIVIGFKQTILYNFTVDSIGFWAPNLSRINSFQFERNSFHIQINPFHHSEVVLQRLSNSDHLKSAVIDREIKKPRNTANFAQISTRTRVDSELLTTKSSFRQTCRSIGVTITD